MTMHDSPGRTAAALAAACLFCLCGCTREPDTPNNSSVRANAMEDYQAGRIDAAIAGFEHVLKNDPKDYLAHFQLATLLQEQRKDYLGALVHFSLYLDMRPAEDKTTLAADRIEECKNMMLAAQARKGGVAPARPAGSADADKKHAEESARLSAEVERLRKENQNLRYLLSSLGETGKGRGAALSAEAKKLLAELRVSETEEPRRRSIIPTDKELLEDDGEDGPLVSSPAVKDQISKVKRDEASGSVRPPAIQKPNLPADEAAGPTQPPPTRSRLPSGNRRSSSTVRRSRIRSPCRARRAAAAWTVCSAAARNRHLRPAPPRTSSSPATTSCPSPCVSTGPAASGGTYRRRTWSRFPQTAA